MTLRTWETASALLPPHRAPEVCTSTVQGTALKDQNPWIHWVQALGPPLSGSSLHPRSLAWPSRRRSSSLEDARGDGCTKPAMAKHKQRWHELHRCYLTPSGACLRFHPPTSREGIPAAVPGPKGSGDTAGLWALAPGAARAPGWGWDPEPPLHPPQDPPGARLSPESRRDLLGHAPAPAPAERKPGSKKAPHAAAS